MNDVVVVNEKDEVIGTMSREEAHRTGTLHRIAVVYVSNPQGQILIQVRKGGRLDHSSAGHVDPGEEYRETARRELKEELGIEGVELALVGSGISSEGPPAFTENRTHVMQIFSCTAVPGDLQTDEVEGVYWADPKEVLADMQADTASTKYSGGFRTSLPIFLAQKG